MNKIGFIVPTGAHLCFMTDLRSPHFPTQYPRVSLCDQLLYIHKILTSPLGNHDNSAKSYTFQIL